MRRKPGAKQSHGEKVIKDIRRATRKQYSAEEKIGVAFDGLKGEHRVAELFRREGLAQSLYYGWFKEFLEAGKKRLAGDTARSATFTEVKDPQRLPIRAVMSSRTRRHDRTSSGGPTLPI